MPDDVTPAQQAALDEIDAASQELAVYIKDLDTPTLLAELRCGFGRLIPYLAAEHGVGAPPTVLAVALSSGVARFDLNGHDFPVPGAVEGATECACATPDGGIRRRIEDLHRMTHRAMGDHI